MEETTEYNLAETTELLQISYQLSSLYNTLILVNTTVYYLFIETFTKYELYREHG